MATSLDDRRRAYICFRPIFEEKRGKCREKKHIRKILDHHPAIQELRAQMGHQKLMAILRKQVKEGIFDSELRAWQDFPELFQPDSESPHLVQQVADEARADGDGPADAVPMVDDELESADITSNSSGDPEESGVRVQTVHKEGMKLLSVGAGTSVSIPPLPEQFFPYSAQHAILSRTQTILEEACFAFAQKHLPSVLEESGFDCPAAVELSQWAKILKKYRHRLVKDVPDIKDPSFSGLLVSVRTLRNIAVHRIPTAAVEVARLVGAAAALTEILQDHERTGSLQAMHYEINEKMEVIEVSRQILRQKADLELEDIRRAREELDRRVREVVAGILREDATHRRTVGNLLEEAAGRALTERGASGAKHSGIPDRMMSSVCQDNTEPT